MTNENLNLDALFSWSPLPVPHCLDLHLKPRERELLRQTDWSNSDDYRGASNIDESLAFRIAIYERLPQELQDIKGQIPNHDLVMSEVAVNRVGCLLLRMYIHVRLHHYRFASGLALRIVSLPEATSLDSEAKCLLQSLLEGLVIFLPPDIAYDFGRRVLSHRSISTEPRFALLVSFSKACELIARKSPQEALPCIGDAYHQSQQFSDRQSETAVHLLEAYCRRLLDQPAEEFYAYRQWRSVFATGIGQAAADARAAGELAREAAILSGARRFHELALVGGDKATATGLADDFRRFGYTIAPSMTSSSPNVMAERDDPGEYGSWQVFTLAPSASKPTRKALTEIIFGRKEKLAFVCIEPAYPAVHMQLFRKSATEENFAEKFLRALERELDGVRDSRTHVNLLPGRDGLSNYWLICQRNSERIALGIRISDLGDSFKAQAVPIIALPETLPDESWLRKAEEEISLASHRGNVWQGDMDLTVERAARGMTPSLAPLEINRGIIRELD